MPRMRAIVVGLGVMGSYHLRVLQALDGVDVVAGVDPDADRRAAARSRYRDLRVCPSLAEALEARPDVAAIAVPLGSLPDAAREAIDAGVAVLVEKPLAPSEDVGEALVRHAEAAGVPLGVGHVERFNPAVRELKRRLGAAGRIYQILARRLSPPPNRANMYGVALDLATHDLDIMRMLTGAEVTRVYAETAHRATAQAEDLLSATIRFEDGATGLLEVNWLTPAKVRELIVTGEHGMFVVNYLTQDLSFYENPLGAIDWEALGIMRGTGEGDMTRFALTRREPLVVEWEDFLDALRDGTPPPVTGWDGLAALSCARAIQRSGAEHRAIEPAYRPGGG